MNNHKQQPPKFHFRFNVEDEELKPIKQSKKEKNAVTSKATTQNLSPFAQKHQEHTKKLIGKPSKKKKIKDKHHLKQKTPRKQAFKFTIDEIESN